MKRLVVIFSLCFLFCGCSAMCEFGKTDTSSGVECHRVFAKAEVGMSQKEVEAQIGSPQMRNVDVPYRGKTYDEVWVYDTTPPTVLYFKGGILQEKEYEEKKY